MFRSPLAPQLRAQERRRAVDIRQRDGVDPTVSVHEEGVDDGEGQRQREGETGAVALLALQRHVSLEVAPDTGGHHVHSDAPAGEIRHDLLGAEPGEKNEVQQLRLRHGRRILHPQLQGLAADALPVQPAAVVGELYDDAATLAPRGDAHTAALRLAHAHALLRELQPVVQRVADDVRERVGECFHDPAVDLRVLALHDQLHRLAQLPREVTHQAGELAEDDRDGDHPRVNHDLLHPAGYLVEGVEGIRELLPHRLGVHAAAQVVGKPGNVGLVHHELRDQAPQVVQLARVDTYGRLLRLPDMPRGFAAARSGRGGGGTPAKELRVVQLLQAVHADLVHFRRGADQLGPGRGSEQDGGPGVLCVVGRFVIHAGAHRDDAHVGLQVGDREVGARELHGLFLVDGQGEQVRGFAAIPRLRQPVPQHAGQAEAPEVGPAVSLRGTVRGASVSPGPSVTRGASVFGGARGGSGRGAAGAHPARAIPSTSSIP